MKNLIRDSIATTIVFTLLATAGYSQPTDGVVANKEILHELREIRKLLEVQARLPPVPSSRTNGTTKVNVGDAAFLGQEDAPYTLVMFTDYECGFCQRFQEQTFPLLRKSFIDKGAIRFYVLDFPLQSHHNAPAAAEAARCAADQGKFWTMHHQMQSQPAKLQMVDLVEVAEMVKLDMPQFRACMESRKYREAVMQSARDALASGISGTPTFVFGKSTQDGVEGELIVGALPYETFEAKFKMVIK